MLCNFNPLRVARYSNYLKGVLIILHWCAIPKTTAQVPVKKTGQIWSEIDVSGHINKKLFWQFDIQYARQGDYENTNLFYHNSQLTLRPWIHYFPTKNIRLSAFAGLWYNYAITEVGNREFPEHREAIQFSYFDRKPYNILMYRFRPEYRNILNKQGTWVDFMRLRTMLKYTHMFNKPKMEQGTIYMVASEEVFARTSSSVSGNHLFDQNRLFVGLGYNFTNDICLEMGYFNQMALEADGSQWNMNHVSQFTIYWDNIDFFDF